MVILNTMGYLQHNNGDYERSINSFRGSLEIGRNLACQISNVYPVGILARELNSKGRLKEATEICGKYIDKYGSSKYKPPILSFIFSTYGLLKFEVNEIEQASIYIDEGMQLSEQSGIFFSVIAAKRALAKVQNAKGNTEAALKIIESAHEYALTAGDKSYSAVLEAIEAELNFSLGNTALADMWLQNSLASTSKDLNPRYCRELIARSRIMIGKNQLVEANKTLDLLEHHFSKTGVLRRLITVLVLQSLLRYKLRNIDKSVTYLKRALEIASPANYIRPFLDEGNQVLDVLKYLKEGNNSLIKQINEAFNVTDTSNSLKSLIEPLTMRELEILHRLSAGSSNTNIANDLVITIGTVKSHIHQIYGKLGVSSRTQAIMRAQELGILYQKTLQIL
jgi:LuxR family transcriptional regulator, maltose regulon positive regulatory protein